MMKRITAKMLEKDTDGGSACMRGLALFRQIFPNGMSPTPDNIASLALLEEKYQIRSVFYWGIHCCRIFGDSAGHDWNNLRIQLNQRELECYSQSNAEAAIALVMALEDWEYEKGEENEL